MVTITSALLFVAKTITFVLGTYLTYEFGKIAFEVRKQRKVNK